MYFYYAVLFACFYILFIIVVKAMSPPSRKEVIARSKKENPYKPSRIVPLIDTKTDEWILWDNKEMKRVK